jgi:hypothetical protein
MGLVQCKGDLSITKDSTESNCPELVFFQSAKVDITVGFVSIVSMTEEHHRKIAKSRCLTIKCVRGHVHNYVIE